MTKSMRMPFSLPVMIAAGTGCPVPAWNLYTQAAPSSPEAVLFTDAYGAPYTPACLTPMVRMALVATGVPEGSRFPRVKLLL